MAMLNNQMVIKPGYMLYINVIWNWEYIQYHIYMVIKLHETSSETASNSQ